MKATQFISLLFLLTVIAGGCNQTYHGEGPVIVVDREVNDIHRLAVNMSVDVSVTDTTVSFCRVHAQENIMEAIRTKVEGQTLYISCKGNLVTAAPVWIEVGMVRPDGIEVNGSAEVTGTGTFKNDKITFEVNGSGKLQIDQVTLKTKTTVAGSGTVALSGTTNEHVIEISGSGIVHAYELNATVSDIDISGSGQAFVNTTQKLTADVAGSGEVIYIGDPEVKADVEGSGTVSKK